MKIKKAFQGFIATLILTTAVPLDSFAQAATYFISPSGDDSNSGVSKENAWLTLDKVNQVHFEAGDSILLEAGGVWNGQMCPLGSGEPGKPIRLGSYGDGPMPVINTGREEGVGIQLVNQSWWEIQGIEICSGAPHELGIRRGGIVASVEGQGEQIEHIVIRDCYVHDIWGQVGGEKSGVAIYVGQLILSDTTSRNCVANDVLVENNTIKRVDKMGIVVIGKNDVIVRGNYMENLGGDGIVVWGADRGLIEKNIADRTCLRSGDPDLDTGGEDWWPHTAAIWIIACTETVMQFNEVYNTGRQPGNGDGFAYDFDYGCRKCVIQYNYSANGHGFLLIMNRTYDNVARYNISQNDQTHLIQIHGNTEDGNLIYNNVFYVDHSTVDMDYYCGMDNEKDKAKLGATFRNNIFYAGGQGRFRTVYSHGSALDRQFNDTLRVPPSEGGPVFQRNCYFGPWLNGVPDDMQKLLADPLFSEPGGGGYGGLTLDAYHLRRGSPCINTGAGMEEEHMRDFFGNPLNDGMPDIGAYEYIPQIIDIQ
jgi:hypothetical protein